MTKKQPWDLYQETRDRFIELARSLDEEQALMTVPITPGWNVAEVVAHVCGLNGDIAAGLREGLGSAERTADQVNSRVGMSIEQICDEWLGHGPIVGQLLTEVPLYGERLAADLIVHLHDVQHALGIPVDRDDEATISGGRTYASRMVEEYVLSSNANVVIDLGTDGRFEPADPPGDAAQLTLRTTAFDYLRSVTGRRSSAEVAALDWTGDPTPLLVNLSPYGSLRDEDAGF